MLSIERTDKSILGRWWWTVDRWLMGAIFGLVLAGIILVMAASPAVADRIGLPPFHFVIRHIVFLIPALGMMIALSMMQTRNIWRAASALLAGAFVLLIATLVFGSDIKGATRWIHMFGFSLQPSEFIKPAFAVTAAWLIARQQADPQFPGMMAATGVYLVLISMLLLQPDLGMSIVLSLIWGVQIFLAGLSFALIALLGILGIGGIIGAYFVFPHVQSRIDRFLNPAAGDNYQVQKSLDSFHEGGLFGTGPGEGHIKLYLPDAHADFIFAVAGEEFGLILTLLLIGIFAFIVIRGMARVWEGGDIFRILAVTGILVQFGAQALIHMGSSLQLIPAKGMTLPFVSYGGSSLLSLGIAMGFVLALTRKEQTRDIFSAARPLPAPTIRAARPFFK
ncbi:MAG: cell division protein FtsW [Alphaproteobacteria bacterium]|nr:MAG: cell division protein FtsW [Alphaproteobacteria bacterium]